MKAEAAMAVASVICLVLAAYFAWLSPQMVDTDAGTRLLIVAEAILVAGIVILISMISSMMIKRLFKSSS